MADLPTFTVTGVPIFGDPFTADGLPEFLGPGLSLNELAALQEAANPGATPEPEEAFAPPVPPVLPPPPVIRPPPPVLPEVIVRGATSVVGGMLFGIGAILFPQPTGPREFDEAPTPPGDGGNPPPPGATDPIMPPNWDDLGAGGDSSLLDPLILTGVPIPTPPVEMPPGEKFFDVSPPLPTFNPFDLPWLTFEPNLQPIEVPADYGIELPPLLDPDTGPGPAPAPTGTPRSDPVPGRPDLAPDLQPGDRTAPLPFNPTAPDVFGAPLPDVFGDPIGDPIVTPELPGGTRPSPRTPAAPTAPDFFVDFAPPGPTLSPFETPLLTDFGPTSPPTNKTDTCKCNEKKKKPKKRPPRSVCYRGTYVQRSRGTTFTPKEEVPCESKPTVRKRSTTKPGQFPGASFAGGLTRDQAADLALQAVSEFSPIIEDYLNRKYAKPKKAKKPKRNRKAKTKPGRLPGTVYTSPFPIGD